MSIQYHKQDLFWFVTNVPFGATVGKHLAEAQFVLSALKTEPSDGVRKIIGGLNIDDGLVRSLAERLSVCILTDSFMRIVGLAYHVAKDDTMWRIIKRFHAETISDAEVIRLLEEAKRLNSLPNLDYIQAGQRIRIPWRGI